MEEPNLAIRLKIDEILDDQSQNAILKYSSTAIYENKFERLKKLGINVEKDNNFSSLVIPCFPYALGFKNSKKYKDMCMLDPENNAIKSSFITYLLSNRYLQELSTPESQSLVLYFKDINSPPKHAGVLLSSSPFEKIVISRWGDFPAIFMHKLYYVPQMYGDMIKYYTPLKLEIVENYYLEFLNRTELVD